MIRRDRLKKRTRGQATVELAVLMIVIVPMFMYVIFLDDLLRYKLDLAQAVFAAPWDFTTLNYEQAISAPDIQHLIRLDLCDHTTAYQSYENSYECGDNHHVALAAHQCWISPGAQQVACTIPKADMGQDPYGLALTTGVKDFNHGGQISCTARLAVINYFLPQKVLSQFSQVDMTSAEHRHNGTSVHDISGLTMQNTYVLERQTMSILTDTWAMTTVEDVDPTGNSGLLYDRVNKEYQTIGTTATILGVAKFVLKASLQEKMLSPSVAFDLGTLGDSTITPQVGFTKAAPPQIDDFYASPWKDNSGNHVEGAYNARGNKYLGWTQDPN